MWKLLVLHRDQVCQLRIKREREKVVETVSFTKGSGVSTKDQERERERERESCGNC